MGETIGGQRHEVALLGMDVNLLKMMRVTERDGFYGTKITGYSLGLNKVLFFGQTNKKTFKKTKTCHLCWIWERVPQGSCKSPVCHLHAP